MTKPVLRLLTYRSNIEKIKFLSEGGHWEMYAIFGVMFIQPLDLYIVWVWAEFPASRIYMLLQTFMEDGHRLYLRNVRNTTHVDTAQNLKSVYIWAGKPQENTV
jgi:hypothetical protein